jgi:hypothetical protein
MSGVKMVIQVLELLPQLMALSLKADLQLQA